MADGERKVSSNTAGDPVNAAFEGDSLAVMLTNPRLENSPIVYVNTPFIELTGYDGKLIVGQTWDILHGDDTDQSAIEQLKDAVQNEMEMSVAVTCYRADGEPFSCQMMVSPLYGAEGDMSYVMASMMDTNAANDTTPAEDALRELQHRVKNHLSMVVGLIRMQARDSDAESEYSTLSRRVEVLQLLYDEMSSRPDANSDTIQLGSYISRVGNALAHLDGRAGVRVNIDVDSVEVPFEAATRIGLVVSEVITNALQHAFEGRDEGLLEIRLSVLSGGSIRITVEDDGVGMPTGSDWPQDGSLGSRIVRQLVSGLEAEISAQQLINGSTVIFDVPSSTVQI